MTSNKRGKINRLRFLRTFFVSAPLLAVADAFALEPGWVKVRKLSLNKTKPTHRFVQFTDLHHKGDRAYLQSVVKTINELSPEFVCFTGDIVEDTQFLAEALELMQAIKAPLYGIPGNRNEI